MTFGDDWGWGEGREEARKVYDAFREAGGNFIGTANIYTNGTSESFLGEFIQGHPAWMVSLRRAADRIEPARADGRTGTDPYGEGAEYRPQHGAGRPGVASLSSRAGHPDRRSARPDSGVSQRGIS